MSASPRDEAPTDSEQRQGPPPDNRASTHTCTHAHTHTLFPFRCSNTVRAGPIAGFVCSVVCQRVSAVVAGARVLQTLTRMLLHTTSAGQHAGREDDAEAQPVRGPWRVEV